VGPERVRMNEHDKSNETKISKDGLQVRPRAIACVSCVSCVLHCLIVYNWVVVGVQLGKAHVLAGHHGLRAEQCQGHVRLLVLRGGDRHREPLPDRVVFEGHQVHTLGRCANPFLRINSEHAHAHTHTTHHTTDDTF
jgi:hypothetical protein